jgi:hypothetical protein
MAGPLQRVLCCPMIGKKGRRVDNLWIDKRVAWRFDRARRVPKSARVLVEKDLLFMIKKCEWKRQMYLWQIDEMNIGVAMIERGAKVSCVALLWSPYVESTVAWGRTYVCLCVLYGVDYSSIPLQDMHTAIHEHIQLNKMIINSTQLYSTVLCSTLLYCAVLYSTLLYCAVLYSTLLYSTLLYSTLL